MARRSLYRLEEDGLIVGEWGLSKNSRRARFYRLTKAGRKTLGAETKNWQRVSLAITRVLQA